MRDCRWPIILVATTNAGKIREIRAALAGVPVELVPLADVPPVPEPEETGATFAENARLKAEAYAMATGYPTVAEDSGLSIDALGGRPGVLSARYPGATYAEKFANLYRELERTPRPWTARFAAAVAFVGPGPDGRLRTWFEDTGEVVGQIVPAPRGTNGFGYDPIFAYPPDGRTGGELSDAEKLRVSHRGVAFRKFRTWLER